MDNWEEMERIIEEYNLDGKAVLSLLVDWHGMQLLSDEFMDNLKNCEGYE